MDLIVIQYPQTFVSLLSLSSSPEHILPLKFNFWIEFTTAFAKNTGIFILDRIKVQKCYLNSMN